MTPYLLDTNVLIALAWPNHVHHQQAQTWFARKASAAFRTCPLTQTGFVRISSNPAFTSHAVTPSEALALLERVVHLPGHAFWPDDLPLQETLLEIPTLVGHRQITDAYLLGLATAHGGILATLDRSITILGKRTAVELVA